MAGLYRYRFDEHTSFEKVETTFLLGILAVESLHGETQVRLEATHAMDPDKRTCVISATSKVGEDLNRLFVGFLNLEFGPDAFQVEHVAPHPAPTFPGTAPGFSRN